MFLTEKHNIFENTCRQMFLGIVIRGVIYGELKYPLDDEEQESKPEPSYFTKLSSVDTLDHSIYFKTDDKTVYIFWDNTFVSYGLLSKLIDLTETTNNYEQKWDVSSEPKWHNIIGQTIVDFQILWEEIWTSNLNGSNKVYTTYPQAFKITTSDNDTIIISACEFSRDQEESVYGMMDNILVTTDEELAKQLGIIASI